MSSNDSVLSVSQLTQYLRDLIETDYRTQDLWVEGEVSNLSTPSSGHLYFTLKDKEAMLRCVMWRSQVARQRRLPAAGDQVEVHGRVGIYEAAGQYQLYADLIRPAGQGELYQAFLELKAQLQEEGLFDPERKRPLPAFPRRIGIVTSPTGAALQDALDVLERRFPMAEVLLAETPVQGADAPAGVIDGLRLLQAEGEVDVILLIRGGGSLEDLAAFNEEAVARAIAAADVPIVTGVGHETDFTIADFVADVRAPTPSAAAEIVSPDQAELALSLGALEARLTGAFQDDLESRRWRQEQMQRRLRRVSPRAQLENARQRVDDLQRRAHSQIQQIIQLRRSQLEGVQATLRVVGPPSVLSRGYALVRNQAGDLIRSADQLHLDELISIRLSSGKAQARVEDFGSGDGQNDV
ncbi:MAG: exodeoxyribonuclease VII large subunit [Anaerolineales bacterium]